MSVGCFNCRESKFTTALTKLELLKFHPLGYKSLLFVLETEITIFTQTQDKMKGVTEVFLEDGGKKFDYLKIWSIRYTGCIYCGVIASLTKTATFRREYIFPRENACVHFRDR